MGSITGLRTGNFTDINNSGEIRLTDEALSGTVGQALVSGGEGEPATWGTHTGTIQPLTMGTDLSLASGSATFDGSVADTINAAVAPTFTGGNGIDITGTTISTDNDGTTINNTGGTGAQNQVLKVPNALTSGTNVSFSAGTTYDGSAAITINSTDTDTTYQGSSTINIDTTTNPDTINCLKVPNALTAGTNITFSSGTTYDGSAAITINSTDTDTTYTAGTNLNLAGTTFNLDTSISGMINITFLNDGTTTSITGSTYPGKETSCTDLNLTDTSNIISPYCFHNVYDPVGTDFDALSTTYSGLFLTNVNQDLVALQTSLCIELLCYNYGSSSNRSTYCRLTDNAGTEFSAGTNQGGSGTGTRNTERIVHGMDETDKQIFRITWFIEGLTIGNTYTFNPQAKTSSTNNYIAAGGSYPATFLRGYYLPASGI